MSNRNRRQLDRLHPPIRIRQDIQLRVHLARARSMEPAPIHPPLDEPVHEERQLQRQPQPLVLMPLHPRGQQARVVRIVRGAPVLRHVDAVAGDGPRGAPFGAEVVLHGERDRHEDAHGALDVLPLRGGQGLAAGAVVGVGEDGTDQVTDGGVDGVEAVATVPEAVVGGLVAEDEHQTDDDGEGGDLSSISIVILILSGWDQVVSHGTSSHTMVDGNPALSMTYLSRHTTNAVNSAWQITGTMIAPCTAPLMKRKTSGHLYTSCQYQYLSEPGTTKV